MGDDGLNVHAMYFIVKKILNSTALIVQTLNWADILNVGSGTDLEFDTPDQPFTPHATGTVTSTQVVDSTTRLFTFANPVDVHVNDYVVVSDAPRLIIRNFTVEINRSLIKPVDQLFYSNRHSIGTKVHMQSISHSVKIFTLITTKVLRNRKE